MDRHEVGEFVPNARGECSYCDGSGLDTFNREQICPFREYECQCGTLLHYVNESHDCKYDPE